MKTKTTSILMRSALAAVMTLFLLGTAHAEGEPTFDLALLDSTIGFNVLRDMSNNGFFNATRFRVELLTAPGTALGSPGTFRLTSSLLSVNGSEYASFSMACLSGLNQNYRIDWQVEKDSGLTGEAMTRLLNLAVRARTGDIHDVILANVASSTETGLLGVTFPTGDDAGPDYSVTMTVGPSPTYRFWRTLGQLMILNSFGVINYFINEEENMVDWEYEPTPSGFWEKSTDSWAYDTNLFRTNTLYHIYAGIVYYQAARSNGYGPWGSFIWTFAGSTIWEYFGEYREQVSINDQIFTPLGGVILGEGLRQMGLHAERSMRPGFFRGLVCFILDPMRIINRQLDIWVSDDFIFTVSFVNPVQTMISEAVMERAR